MSLNLRWLSDMRGDIVKNSAAEGITDVVTAPDNVTAACKSSNIPVTRSAF